MKYLKSYKLFESLGEEETLPLDIQNQLKDICLELEDEGINLFHRFTNTTATELYGFYPYIFIKSSINVDLVSTVVNRISYYLDSVGYNIKIRKMTDLDGFKIMIINREKYGNVFESVDKTIPLDIQNELKDICLELNDEGIETHYQWGSLDGLSFKISKYPYISIGLISLNSKRDIINTVIDRISYYLDTKGYKIDQKYILGCWIIEIIKIENNFSNISESVVKDIIPKDIQDELKDICLELNDEGIYTGISGVDNVQPVFSKYPYLYIRSDKKHYEKHNVDLLNQVVDRISYYLNSVGYNTNILKKFWSSGTTSAWFIQMINIDIHGNVFESSGEEETLPKNIQNELKDICLELNDEDINTFTRFTNSNGIMGFHPYIFIKRPIYKNVDLVNSVIDRISYYLDSVGYNIIIRKMTDLDGFKIMIINREKYGNVFESVFVSKDDVDTLLDKISQSGITSLSDIDKNRLTLFSEGDKEIIETIEKMGDITKKFKEINAEMRRCQDSGESDGFHLMKDWMKLNNELRPLEQLFRKWGIELGDYRLSNLMSKVRPDVYSNVFEGKSEEVLPLKIQNDLRDICLELNDEGVKTFTTFNTSELPFKHPYIFIELSMGNRPIDLVNDVIDRIRYYLDVKGYNINVDKRLTSWGLENSWFVQIIKKDVSSNVSESIVEDSIPLKIQNDLKDICLELNDEGINTIFKWSISKEAVRIPENKYPYILIYRDIGVKHLPLKDTKEVRDRISRYLDDNGYNIFIRRNTTSTIIQIINREIYGNVFE